MKLEDIKMYRGWWDYELVNGIAQLTREQKWAISAIPTKVRSFVLESASLNKNYDEISCHLRYKSSLCGIKGTWLYHPEIHTTTKIDDKAEGRHVITWVILVLFMEEDMAQNDLDAIPELQKYKRHTVRGYIRAVDRMARLLGWKPSNK